MIVSGLAACQTRQPAEERADGAASQPATSPGATQPAATRSGRGGPARTLGFSEAPANPEPTHVAAALTISPDRFNVRRFGARGDGKHLDSPAINKAIEAAAKAGGGTVYLPAGTYLSGSIRLKNNICLELDAGATLLGAPQELRAYDPPEPFEGPAYQDGGHTYFHNSLIWGENLTNVGITGRGMIDGGGLTRRDRNVGQGPINMGDKAIALKLCQNVLIRDITLFHGGHFAILATGCDRMTLDNVTIDTNRDGIDIDCCRNTIVSNCRVNSPADDGICPKSTYALGKNVITENLTITNCQVSGFEEGTLLDGRMLPSRSRFGRIKFGTESNGGFRNVTVSNCTFRMCRGLAIEMVDGGVLENFTINNLTMMDTHQYPIYIRLGARNRAPQGVATGIVRNISISHVIATDITKLTGIQIMGVPGHAIENVRLEDIRLVFKGGGTKEEAARIPGEFEQEYPEPSRWGVTPAYGLFARHVKGLELSHITMSVETPDQRPALMCVDVEGLEIDHLKAATEPGVPTGRLEAVKGLMIESSPSLQGDKLQQSDNIAPPTTTRPIQTY